MAHARIGYARVSTDEQNLDLQIDALREAGCLKIFSDHGVSAIAHRPEFERMLKSLQHGDTLVIWKMDRAFRSLLHALEVFEDLQNRGVEFRSLTDAIDTTTPMGRFAYQVRNAFSELEREIIAERTKAGMAAARRRGRRMGRRPLLTEKQIEEARDAIEEQGEAPSDVAARLGVHPRTLQRKLAQGRRS